MKRDTLRTKSKDEPCSKNKPCEPMLEHFKDTREAKYVSNLNSRRKWMTKTENTILELKRVVKLWSQDEECPNERK